MYTTKMKADDWIAQTGLYANQVVSAADTGKLLADKWNAMVYGLTDEQILALPQLVAMTQADLTVIKYALGSLSELSNALHNIVVAQANRYAYLEPFLLG